MAVLLLISSSSAQLLFVNSSTSSSPSSSPNSSPTLCSTNTIDPQIDKISSQVSQLSATSVANQSLAHRGWAIQSLTFNSVFERWSFDPVSCAVTLQTVGVAYDSKTQNETIVVYEDAKTTTVQNVSVTSTSVKGTQYFSGYQYNIVNTYDVQAKWAVPSSYNPDSNNCWNGNQYICDLVMWTGESTAWGGSSGFAQGGSDSFVTCRFITKVGWICTPSYDIWYEFPPAGSVACGGTVNSGDTILAEMSWSSNTERIYVYDYSTNAVCSASTSLTTAPSYELFIAEFPTWSVLGSQGFYYLPGFSQFTVYNAMINNLPMSDYMILNTFQMTNGPGGEYNIILGSASYSSQLGSYFTETWQTSAGT
jgi:hypothetical protein